MNNDDLSSLVMIYDVVFVLFCFLECVGFFIVFDMFGYCLGMFWIFFGHVLDMFEICFGHALGVVSSKKQQKTKHKLITREVPID